MSGRPFFFDGNIFDEDSPDFYDKKLSEEQELKYSDEQAQEIQKQAFEEGRRAGLKEAEGGITRQIQTLIGALQHDVKGLYNAEEQRGALYENEAVHLSLKIYRKLFPLLSQDFGVKEIEKSIITALQKHKTPERISIELRPQLLEQLETFLKEQELQLDKTIKLVANESLTAMEYRILWPEGGIISNRDSIAQKTAEIMQEALAENGINVHDEDESPIDGEPADTAQQDADNIDTIKEQGDG